MNCVTGGTLLLLGEGDFSFTLSFRRKLPEDVSVISTSFLSHDEVRQLHKNAERNIEEITANGVQVLHSVNATMLTDSDEINTRKFRRIIFNFPHIGGKSNIKKNRQLMKDFFMSVSDVLEKDGDICLTLAQGQGGTPADKPIRAWHDSWQAVGMAAYSDIILAEVWPFCVEDYPEYCSTGFRSRDQTFFTGGALTYVFRRATPLPAPPQPCAVGPVPVTLGTHNYCADPYIVTKLNRQLLSRKGHPICLLKDQLFDLLCGQTLIPVHPRPEVLSPVICRPCERMAANTASGIYFVTQQLDPVRTVGSGEKSPKLNCDSREELKESSLKPGSQEADLTDVVNQESKQENQIHSTDLGDQSHFLRATMLQHLETKQLDPKLLAPRTIHLLAGDVFRRLDAVDSKQLPAAHEVIGVMKTSKSQSEVSMDNLKSTLSGVLTEMLEGCDAGVIFSESVPGASTELSSYRRYLTEDRVTVIEAGYRSKNCLSQIACNQVDSKGKAAVPTDIPKFLKYSRSLGLVSPIHLKAIYCDEEESKGDHEGEDCLLCFSLCLDTLAQIKFDINDARLLWSENVDTLRQLQSVSSPSPYKPLSLYPPLWRHDVSFWESLDKAFDEKRLLDIIRTTGGEALREVILMNVWPEPGTARISRCYRQIYQSSESAISHQKAHAFQNSVRLTLEKEMHVELK